MADSPFPSYYFHRFEVRSKRPSAWEEVPCALGLEHHHVALPFLHLGGCRIGSDLPLGGRLSAAAAVSWETVGSACIALRDPQTSQWSYVSFEKAKQAVWLLRHLGMLSLNPYIKCRNLQFRTYLKVNAWHFWLLRTKFTFFFFCRSFHLTFHSTTGIEIPYILEDQGKHRPVFSPTGPSPKCGPLENEVSLELSTNKFWLLFVLLRLRISTFHMYKLGKKYIHYLVLLITFCLSTD